MRALLFHFSSLVGLLVFLNQLWHAAEIERTVFMAFAAGLVMYTLLMVGYAATRHILKNTSAEATGEAADTPTDEPTTE